MVRGESTISEGCTWVVVADAKDALFYTRDKRHSIPERFDVLHASFAAAHDQELTTDRPGRTFDRFGPGRHTLNADESPKEEEQRRFVKRIAEKIDHGHAAGKFDRLVLVAPPAMLGVLRKHLTKATAATVIGEIGKTLTEQSPEKLAEELDR